MDFYVVMGMLQHVAGFRARLPRYTPGTYIYLNPSRILMLAYLTENGQRKEWPQKLDWQDISATDWEEYDGQP